MKITLDLPDDLLHKAQALSQGQDLNTFLTQQIYQSLSKPLDRSPIPIICPPTGKTISPVSNLQSTETEDLAKNARSFGR